jgi:hypothetical protein
VWYRRRPSFGLAAGLLIAAGVASYFGSAPARSLASPVAERDVFGFGALLIRAGRPGVATALAAAAIAAVYLLAYTAIRRGRPPVVWAIASWFAWVAMVSGRTAGDYVDLFTFAAFASLADAVWTSQRVAASGWIGGVLAGAIATAGAMVTAVPGRLVLDIGTPDARAWLVAGFAADEDNGRSFAWVDGTAAAVLLPRRSGTAAEIALECQPNLPTPAAGQTMSVALNGVVLGTVPLREGWQTVRVEAPARAWIVGANILDLAFSSAVSPLSLGASEDPRQLSVAFDRISVTPK